MQNNVFYTNKTLNVRGKLIDLHTPRVMGILNITPDSFYDGGKFAEAKNILDHVQKMLQGGADFIDVGGYSSRPGASDVSEEEESSRILPVIRSVLQNFPEALISVDTFRSAVAKKAVEAGAALINDISGGTLDPAMFDTAASLGVPYVLMHMRGTPQTMTQQMNYEDLFKEITDYFHQKIYRLRQAGVKDIIVDPGFGFAKAGDQNFALLQQLDHFRVLGVPILAGLSRKSMIWRTLGVDASEALTGTIALNTVALLKGASILRVHDVTEAGHCVKLVTRLLSSSPSY